MNKKDILVFAVFLVVALLGVLLILLTLKSGTSVAVTVDGKLTGRYALSKDREVLIEDGAGGTNLMVILDGKVYIKEANCPNQDCVRQGEISYNNESIICLPHKVVITVLNPKDEGLDEETR